MLYSGDEKMHNNPNMSYVDANAVRGAPRSTLNLSTLLTDFADKADQLKEGVTKVYVISETKDYRLVSIAQIGNLQNGWAIANPVSSTSGLATESFVATEIGKETTIRVSALSTEKTQRESADSTLAGNIISGDASTLSAAKAYTDAQTTSIMRLAGNFDASTGNYPSAGTGTSGAIRRGDAYPVTVAGAVGGQNFDVGDMVYCLSAPPGQIAANWGVSEHNLSQASEVVTGTAKIALQTVVETETTQDDLTIVTPKKIWQAIARLLNLDAVVNGVYRFSNGFKIGTAALYAAYTRSSASNLLQLSNKVYQAGAIGKAKVFNGTNQYAYFEPLLQVSSQFVLEIWFNTTKKTGTQTLISLSKAGTFCTITLIDGYLYATHNAGTGWNVYPGNIVPSLSSKNYADGAWHHIRISMTSSIGGGLMYVDNVYTQTFNWITANLASERGYLGCYLTSTTPSNYFAGKLDQTLVYNQNFTPANYKDGFGTATPVIAGLIRRWEFDEASTTVGADDSGYNAPLTFINNPVVTNLGKVPTGGASSEAIVFQSVDGVTNGERGQQTFGDATGGNIQQGKAFRVKINGSYPIWVDNYGRTMVNPYFDGLVEGAGALASAYLHLAPGKSTPGDAALKLTPGSLLAAIEDGAFEYNGADLYFSTGTTRKKLNDQSAAASSPPLQVVTPDAGTTPYITDKPSLFLAPPELSGAATLSLTLNSPVGNFQYFKNRSGYTLTVNMVNSTIDGASSLSVSPGEKRTIIQTSSNVWVTY